MVFAGLSNPVARWARGPRASGGPRATTMDFYSGIINKMAQIQIVGLNIESIVSFPHNRAYIAN